ncbi:hypothetical protein, partial [Klebsiella pneumoniae]
PFQSDHRINQKRLMLPEYSFFAPARVGFWNLAGNHSQPTNSLYHQMMVMESFLMLYIVKIT